MSIPEASVITRYFEADARRDIEAIVALFTDEAVVVDEGQTYHGTAEIRGWQKGAASRISTPPR
jgi:ketosteroid isomerase-like protein